MRNFLSRRENDGNFIDSVFNNAFNDFWGFPTLGFNSFDMKTDIKETEKEFALAVDLPGFDKKDINLSLDNGYLTVKAQREKVEEDKDFIRRERNYSCVRSYYVGDSVTEEDIKAKYDNGTLSITVPKKDKKELSCKTIQID